MANRNYSKTVVEGAIRSEITSNLVSLKANVCPMTVRLAWHASGTYDKSDTSSKSGGSDGATMRFEPEITDGANAGLDIMQKILEPVKKRFPDLSYADLWTIAGTQAIKLMGGPDVPFNFGRSDKSDNTTCPVNGRLPDASLGADHLREVFYRMGFDDKDIVALSGAHTVGSCHETRSGFDGPWTSNPLKFDNEYFKNLLDIKWKPREWDGPLQYTDPSDNLMMLPTDMALIEDKSFLPYVKAYAKDQELFFTDFSTAFSKLISLGCPEFCQPNATGLEPPVESDADKDFRDLAMHGLLLRMKDIPGSPNPNSREHGSNRTPMHKAAFFGHVHIIEYLVDECGADINPVDFDGDTPLHDASRMGHEEVIDLLVQRGALTDIKNKRGETAKVVVKSGSTCCLL